MKEGEIRFPHPSEDTNPKEETTTFSIKSGQQVRTTKPNETTTEETETTRPKNKGRPRIRKNKEITIATINVRRIKGKIRNLETALNTEKISIALITETQLKKGEQISIKGYRWIHRPRPNNKGGGVGIIVAEKLAQSTTEDTSNEDHEQLETKWIKLECRPRNIAIGVFYGPQENEKMENAKDIFTAIGHQIAQKAQNNEVIIAGDFNAKLQINSNSCKQHISRNGKLLREIMDNNDLTPANLKSNHGIWTRVNRKNEEEKSVIDYILTTEQIARNIQSVIVDEEGNLRIRGKNETDHNTIVMSIRINDPRKPTSREKWNLKNEEGWTKFNKEILEAYNSNNIKVNNYQEAEKEIKKILKKTIGTKKIRSDKTRRITNQDIKEARKLMKKTQKGIPENMQNRHNRRQNNNQENLYGQPGETPLRDKQGWIHADRRETKKTTWKSNNKPKHNMGSQEKSERMQGTWLQHILRGRHPNRRPWKNKRSHSKLLWTTLPSQRRHSTIRRMDK